MVPTTWRSAALAAHKRPNRSIAVVPASRMVTAIVIFFPALVSVAGLIGTSGLFCTGRSKGANINHGLVLAATAASLVGGLYLILLIVLAVRLPLTASAVRAFLTPRPGSLDSEPHRAVRSIRRCED